MALDKLVDSTALDNGLTTVADAIRTKGGTTAQLSFPQGMATAISAITTGEGGAYNVTSIDNGDGTQSLAITDASGGGGGDSFDNYDQYEWVYTSGTNGSNLPIDLVLANNSNYRIEIDMFLPTLSQRYLIIGNYFDNQDERNFSVETNVSNQVRLYGKGEVAKGGTITSKRNKFIIEINNATVTVSDSNDVQYVSGNFVDFVKRPLNIFSDYRYEIGNIKKGYIHSVQVWENNSLINDIVPCKRKADDVTGIYDKAKNRFSWNTIGKVAVTNTDPT